MWGHWSMVHVYMSTDVLLCGLGVWLGGPSNKIYDCGSCEVRWAHREWDIEMMALTRRAIL
jgi:hypothetical protein